MDLIENTKMYTGIYSVLLQVRTVLLKWCASIVVEILDVIQILVLDILFNYTAKLEFLNFSVIPSLKF